MYADDISVGAALSCCWRLLSNYVIFMYFVCTAGKMHCSHSLNSNSSCHS